MMTFIGRNNLENCAFRKFEVYKMKIFYMIDKLKIFIYT